ncbi:hypothetical protein [Vreelandella aquamarina]|uniref:Uncharacterized protein n=1 Tax=Vreelandella aquamarina TaxID=77097 RepID=A0A857GH55_9GAMM|nr:hypothetical protein [Halomonas meridiana]QHD48572.1 hypothetical protein CTT34_02110 [Halomonas meridiana]
MTKLVISKIKSPSGALGEIERGNLAVTNQMPLSSWLDAELVDSLLAYHPVSVRKVSRHYEVVSGFRAFHAANALLESEEVIPVQVTNDDEIHLVKGALFELITHSLMHCPDAIEAREHVYRQLNKLSTTLRKTYGIEMPNKLSRRKLKTLLGLKGRRITVSRQRKSELQRIMESR